MENAPRCSSKTWRVPAKEGDEEERDLSMMLVMPGVILSDQALDLPKNLEITITKKGKETHDLGQARRQAVGGGRQVTRQAAEENRPHLEKMLGHGHEMSSTSSDEAQLADPQEPHHAQDFREVLQIAPDKIYELHKSWNRASIRNFAIRSSSGSKKQIVCSMKPEPSSPRKHSSA